MKTTSPTNFWLSSAGLETKGRPEYQIVALYLASSPLLHDTGLYRCPLIYCAHETGIGIDTVREAVGVLEKAGYLLYDEKHEVVWVKGMSAQTYGEQIKINDKRVSAIQKHLDGLPASPVKNAFLARHGTTLRLNGAPSSAEFALAHHSKGEGDPNCPHKEVIDLYHHALPSLPKVISWGGQREKMLSARWKWLTVETRQVASRNAGVHWFADYFKRVAESDFLMGRVSGSSGQPFVGCTLEWLIRPENFEKVLSGKFANRAPPPTQSGHNRRIADSMATGYGDGGSFDAADVLAPFMSGGNR